MRIFAGGACLLVLLNVGGMALADEAPKADNTAQNHGVLEKDSVTAEKQKNYTSDVKVLARLRRSIMDEKGLSMDAQNVKILYSDGQVILRGPVNSENEKSRIEQVIKNCSDVTSIKNELTIAAKPH
ncbi:MAG: BON domain-containing protein [Candidatus Obscuribacterales bacterium]|nr:BON domain-containing protein [Candidatus Obscuribacterales bacterium]